MASSRQSEVEEWERKLYTYHQSHYKLSARVHLSHLTFEQGFRAWMDDRENVQRLEKVMKIEGCRRLMKDNHVPVIVPGTDWERRVTPRYDNGTMPSLNIDLDYRLRALDHENLIAAARKKLDLEDQWWIADVYVTDEVEDGHDVDSEILQEKFMRSLKERYPNDNRPPDGLIYERINYYEGYLDGPEDRLAANNWWAILQAVAGSKKAKYLRRFFKNPTLHRKLNSLLVIPGLWEGMRIGLLHKVTAMHCDEPISSYWEAIFQTYLTIVGGRTNLLPLIDGVTVGLIQARAPKVSGEDLGFLKSKMDEGILFAKFEEEQRQEIWERLKKIDYPIPTLKTFFRDRIYLEVAQSVMKRLFIQPREVKVTIDEGVYGIFNTAVPIPMSQRRERLRPDLLEFWRFSFQYGFEMTNHQRLRTLKSPDAEDTPDRDSSRSLPVDREDIWRHFFGVMRARGFQPPSSMTQSPPMVELPSPVPCDYPENTSEEIVAAKRCGKPFADTMEADWFALSAESLQQHWTVTRVSANFLRRWLFKAFFSYLMNNEDSRSHSFSHRGFEGSSAVHGDRADAAQGNLNPTATMAPDLPEEFPSNLQAFSPAPTVASFAPLAPTPAINFQPSFYVMHITIGEHTETLNLPLDQSFMTSFAQGLSQQCFEVYDTESIRCIRADQCYRHYLDNRLCKLQATFNEDTADIFFSTGNKRRRIDEPGRIDAQAKMDSAKRWLEEEKAKISSIVNTPAI